MSVGFGFSAGDFVAAIGLVHTVIESLSASGTSSNVYQSLISELYVLEDALIRVKHVELDDEQAGERVALERAAAECHRTIDKFMGKIEKYQPHLRAGGSNNKIKDAWMKVRWAVLNKDELEEFKAALRGHQSAIEVLLLSLQMNKASIQTRVQEDRQRTLSGLIQDVSFQVMKKLEAVSNSVASGYEQGKQLLESSAKVLAFNIRVFQMTCRIYDVVTRIPCQVERQQPVYMIDALGRASPFHLEFVRSATALKAILKVNLEHTKTGPGKIDKNEFAIQEDFSQRDIDLAQPWDSCFSPGQKVSMSMIFRNVGSGANSGNCCPHCYTEATDATDDEIVCEKCGVSFRRIEEIGVEDRTGFSGNDLLVASAALPLQFCKRKRDYGIEDDILNFRRVRLETLVMLSQADCNTFQQQPPNVQQRAIDVYSATLAAWRRQKMPQTIGQGGPIGIEFHANNGLKDYQMQLILLEQQNKKGRLMMRQKQDNIID